MKARLGRHKANVGLLLVGAMIGALLIPPVAAHVGGTLNHLWGAPNHLKKKVQTFSDARYHRFGGVLARGKTEKGAWYGFEPGDTANFAATISYPSRLNFNPTVVIVADNAATIPTGCSGDQDNPAADPGYLCIFTSYETNVAEILAYTPEEGSHLCTSPPTPATPVCRYGVVLFAQKTTPSSLAETAGTYAVTAPTT